VYLDDSLPVAIFGRVEVIRQVAFVIRLQNMQFGGNVTVTSSVEFCFSVSALSLIVSMIFAGRGIGSTAGTVKMHKILAAIKRQYKMAVALAGLLLPTFAYAQPEHAGGEANLTLPDLTTVNFLGMNGHALLMIGLLFCACGLLFGLVIYVQLKNLPVHRTMREISEIIYETCKT
jgi:K(+)-stimulated pyrophosphate-energized sodium pump